MVDDARAPRPGPRVLAVLLLAVVPSLGAAGCISPVHGADIGFRVTNQAEGAVGLNLTVQDENGTTFYRSELVVRLNEVALHPTPVPEGAYVLTVELRKGPGLNKEADWGSLPPADDPHTVADVVDGAGCTGLAVLEVRVEQGPQLVVAGTDCLART